MHGGNNKKRSIDPEISTFKVTAVKKAKAPASAVKKAKTPVSVATTSAATPPASAATSESSTLKSIESM